MIINLVLKRMNAYQARLTFNLCLDKGSKDPLDLNFMLLKRKKEYTCSWQIWVAICLFE